MNEDLPPGFYDCVDRFIHLANDMVPEHGVSRVSAMILFAAARFNAHCARELDPDVDENIDEALSDFSEQYSKMLRDNLDRLQTVAQ